MALVQAYIYRWEIEWSIIGMRNPLLGLPKDRSGIPNLSGGFRIASSQLQSPAAGARCLSRGFQRTDPTCPTSGRVSRRRSVIPDLLNRCEPYFCARCGCPCMILMTSHPLLTIASESDTPTGRRNPRTLAAGRSLPWHAYRSLAPEWPISRPTGGLRHSKESRSTIPAL